MFDNFLNKCYLKNKSISKAKPQEVLNEIAINVGKHKNDGKISRDKAPVS